MNSIRFNITSDIFWLNPKGKYHRLNGPAKEWANGNKEWYINGICNRLNGPAREYSKRAKRSTSIHHLDVPTINLIVNKVMNYFTE